MLRRRWRCSTAEQLCAKNLLKVPARQLSRTRGSNPYSPRYRPSALTNLPPKYTSDHPICSDLHNGSNSSAFKTHWNGLKREQTTHGVVAAKAYGTGSCKLPRTIRVINQITRHHTESKVTQQNHPVGNGITISLLQLQTFLSTEVIERFKCFIVGSCIQNRSFPFAKVWVKN